MNKVDRQELKQNFDDIYNDETETNEFLENCVDLTIKTVNTVVSTSNTVWRPICEAIKDINCREIIGCRIQNDVMVREPFITFWSPTLQMYYCDPSHWIAMPTMPIITPENTQLEVKLNKNVLITEHITSTWYPISTAPKDGTYVLLAGPSGYSCSPLEVVVCFWNIKDEDWCNFTWEIVYHDEYKPIYWHPLLEIPNNEGKLV